jgi:N-acetylneuraminate synthase/N,N'-diacetyllegionaminate synthase
MIIGTRNIGHSEPPYIIAEIGVNHDGDPARAIALTRLAASAGADAVKFQLFEADRLMSRAAKLAAYQKAAGETDPIAMLRRLELPLRDLAACVREAHALGIHAIVSVFSVELVAPSRDLAWDAYKSASPDIINEPLLSAMANTGKPLIVSTGASTPEEITRAAKWLAPHAGRIAFLQCVSAYPTPPHLAALEGIAGVKAAAGEPVGYSDHTQGIETGALAVQAGACILEKHFTDSCSRAGPDHRASLEPEAFARYAALARQAAQGPRVAHAPGRKAVLEIEQDVRHASRQSLVATRDLAAGHALAASDLTIKRPGTGIPPFELSRTIGQRLARAVAADVPLTREDLQS